MQEEGDGAGERDGVGEGDGTGYRKNEEGRGMEGQIVFDLNLHHVMKSKGVNKIKEDKDSNVFKEIDRENEGKKREIKASSKPKSNLDMVFSRFNV